jgi:hypothetical protein
LVPLERLFLLDFAICRRSKVDHYAAIRVHFDTPRSQATSLGYLDGLLNALLRGHDASLRHISLSGV